MSIKCNPVDYVYQLPYLPRISVYQMQLGKLCLSFALIVVYQLQHSKSCRSIALSVKRFCLSMATTLHCVSIKCNSFKKVSIKCNGFKKVSINCNSFWFFVYQMQHCWVKVVYQMPQLKFGILSNAMVWFWMSIKCHPTNTVYQVPHVLSIICNTTDSIKCNTLHSIKRNFPAKDTV